MGRTQRILSKGHLGPLASPACISTHGALDVMVHDAFPPFPPTKEKRNRGWRICSRNYNHLAAGFESTERVEWTFLTSLEILTEQGRRMREAIEYATQVEIQRRLYVVPYQRK